MFDASRYADYETIRLNMTETAQWNSLQKLLTENMQVLIVLASKIMLLEF